MGARTARQAGRQAGRQKDRKEGREEEKQRTAELGGVYEADRRGQERKGGMAGWC